MFILLSNAFFAHPIGHFAVSFQVLSSTRHPFRCVEVWYLRVSHCSSSYRFKYAYVKYLPSQVFAMQFDYAIRKPFRTPYFLNKWHQNVKSSSISLWCAIEYSMNMARVHWSEWFNASHRLFSRSHVRSVLEHSKHRLMCNAFCVWLDNWMTCFKIDWISFMKIGRAAQRMLFIRFFLLLFVNSRSSVFSIRVSCKHLYAYVCMPFYLIIHYL